MTNEISFLLCMREALISSIKNSDIKNKKKAVNYIRNEATDYQVMHYVMRGEFPETSRNMLDESVVFEEYKNFISGYLTELGDYDLASSIITEIGPISPYGLDTAKPILESAVFNQFKSGLTRDADAKKLASLAEVNPAKSELARAYQSTGGAAQTAAAGAKAQQAASAVNMPDPTGVNPAQTGMLARGKAMIQQGAAAAKGALAKGATAAQGAWKAAGPAGQVVAGVAAAAAIAYGAYKIYQKFFSQAAKACSNAPDKKTCMANYKQKAQAAQVSALSRGMSKCKDAKCKAALQAKIAKLKK